MPNFDLNQAADFAKLTLSNASGILIDLTGRDASKWDIVEGAFNGVKFHIFENNQGAQYQAAVSQVQDKGGRRKVKYRYPYRDGQTTDDMGRKEFTFDVDCLLFGNQYLQAMKTLFVQLDLPTPGKLSHPIRGDIIVAVEDYELLHSSEKRKAVAIRMTFSEHNFTIGDLRKLADPTVKGALTKALGAFAKISNAIAAVQGAVNFTKGLISTITSDLNAYNQNYGQTLQKMNTTFNGGTSADIPALLPTNQGGNRNPDGTVASVNFPLAAAPNDPFVNLPLAELSNQASLAVATVQALNQVNALRDQVAAIIQTFKDNGAETQFHSTILDLKNTAIDIQDVLETGIASSNSQILTFTTPHDMTIREVAFANGLSVDRVNELDILNPSLTSLNYIVAGTTLQVPSS